MPTPIWLRAADWPRWRTLVPTLPENHKEWAESRLQLLASGDMWKLELDPEHFLAWCTKTGTPVDGLAVTAYASALIDVEEQIGHEQGR